MSKRSPAARDDIARQKSAFDLEEAMTSPPNTESKSKGGRPDEEQVLLIDERPSTKTVMGVPVALFSGAAYCTASMGMVSTACICFSQPPEVTNQLIISICRYFSTKWPCLRSISIQQMHCCSFSAFYASS